MKLLMQWLCIQKGELVLVSTHGQTPVFRVSARVWLTRSVLFVCLTHSQHDAVKNIINITLYISPSATNGFTSTWLRQYEPDI